MGKTMTVAEAEGSEVRELAEALCTSFRDYQGQRGSMRLVDALMGLQNFYAHMMRTMAGAQDLSERERQLFYRMALDTLEDALTGGQ